MTDSLLFIAVILSLLALDLTARAVHSSLLNARHVRLLAMQAQGETQIAHTLHLFGELPRLRASLRFTQILLRLFLAGALILHFLSRQQTAPLRLAGALALAGLALWLSEVVVERLVLQDPEAWAVRLTPAARLLVMLLAPLVILLLRAFPSEVGPERPMVVTEDELKTLVDASQQEGVLEQDEREMIYSIFRIGDTLAREIMVPRIDVFALSIHTPLLEAVDALLKSGFSRVPVYEGTIDNIAGLLYAKDLLRVWREGNQVNSLRDLIRPAYFIPEAKKITELLAEMQAQRIHIAIVVDEYGGMAGLVTLEDIVEEIIGEIQDEYDQAEELLYQEVGDGEYLFHGRIDLDDFNLLLNTQLEKGEAETLGGWIYSHIGRVPKGGESLQAENILLTVEQVIGRRIRKVRAQRSPSVLESDEERSHADG